MSRWWRLFEDDGPREREAMLVDHGRVLSPLVDRSEALLRRHPCVLDPRDELHWAPPLPSPEDWAEALYLLRLTAGSLRSAEGRLVRWREHGGPFV